jgi:hypothetical protein
MRTKKFDPQTTIERIVLRWAKEYGEGKPEEAFHDLLAHGCQSGIVGRLIYYCDTVRFYKRNRAEINAMIHADIEEGLMSSPADLRGWDTEDPLVLDIYNQNLLAWYAFEEAARHLCDRAEIEI